MSMPLIKDISFLVCVVLLFTLGGCRHHTRRNLGDSRPIRCHARRDQAPDVHHFYYSSLPQLKYHANNALVTLYNQSYVTPGSDPRIQASVFQMCITSRNSMIQAVGNQLRTFLQTSYSLHSELKRLQDNLVLTSGSPLQSVTNIFVNTLRLAVCYIDSSDIPRSEDPSGGDEAEFYRDYLTFVLEFLDFVEFIYTNIGYQSRSGVVTHI